jgi:UDP-N-acetylglucosamine--N-acetylmuramyl-(pentapeptide) pyrophosphoryl-undecaprenol N-acetylglucosamine transferase
MIKQGKHIIISGGGTGGHIFPAIAIAKALQAQRPDWKFLFVGAKGKMEMEKVPEAGFEIIGLPVAGLQRRFTLKNLWFPFKLLASMIKAWFVVRKFKPSAAVGVGGYASGPTLKASNWLGIPTVIQEQNSYAGITNKLLGKKAAKVCVAYDHMDRFFPAEKIVFTGNPVRKEISDSKVSREESISAFGLDPNKKTILVVGGSLGARTINKSIKAGLKKLEESGHQVLWQTGKFYYEDCKKAAEEFANIHPHQFIRDMDKAYAAADIVISRAGALSISELCVVGKPCILVPSPNVAEDHQTHNAMALVKQGAALLVRDHDAKEELVDKVLNLMKDEGACIELSKSIRQMAKPDAADRIAKEILEVIG